MNDCIWLISGLGVTQWLWLLYIAEVNETKLHKVYQLLINR
jgi:hypothetical protein